ncbi:MAG: hypothetical protein ACJA13_002765 [Paraglaciecola sp.]|jgi:uncharacterized protein (DUF885 family)
MKLSILAISLSAMALTANSSYGQVSDPQTSQVSASGQQANQTDSQRLATFFADNFQASLQRSPLTQSYLGYKWDYDKWDDISEAFKDQSHAIAQQQLQALSTFNPKALSVEEKVSLALNKAALERQLANDEFRHHDYIMDQFNAYHTMVPSFLINVHRVDNVEDAKAYVSRLEGVNDLFSQVIEQLRIRQELGVFPPKWFYDQMIQAAKNVVSGAPFSQSDDDSSIWQDC